MVDFVLQFKVVEEGIVVVLPGGERTFPVPEFSLRVYWLGEDTLWLGLTHGLGAEYWNGMVMLLEFLGHPILDFGTVEYSEVGSVAARYISPAQCRQMMVHLLQFLAAGRYDDYLRHHLMMPWYMAEHFQLITEPQVRELANVLRDCGGLLILDR